MMYKGLYNFQLYSLHKQSILMYLGIQSILNAKFEDFFLWIHLNNFWTSYFEIWKLFLLSQGWFCFSKCCACLEFLKLTVGQPGRPLLKYLLWARAGRGGRESWGNFTLWFSSAFPTPFPSLLRIFRRGLLLGPAGLLRSQLFLMKCFGKG